MEIIKKITTICKDICIALFFMFAPIVVCTIGAKYGTLEWIGFFMTVGSYVSFYIFEYIEKKCGVVNNEY